MQHASVEDFMKIGIPKNVAESIVQTLQNSEE